MTKDDKNAHAQSEEPNESDSNAILAELKSAYKSLTRLKNSSWHRKITLEIERKIYREHKHAER